MITLKRSISGIIGRISNEIKEGPSDEEKSMRSPKRSRSSSKLTFEKNGNSWQRNRNRSLLSKKHWKSRDGRGPSETKWVEQISSSGAGCNWVDCAWIGSQKTRARMTLGSKLAIAPTISSREKACELSLSQSPNLWAMGPSKHRNTTPFHPLVKSSKI